MSQDRLTLHDLLPAQELAAAIEAGHVTRKRHPDLPLSLYTYTRTAQYERVWNQVTTRCRGLVADDATGAIVALPLPKFFNVGEHESGQPYAPALPDEPFEVYDKVDGSLAVVFHYAGRWRAASKGSFTSTQATWAQRHLDARDTTALVPGTSGSEPGRVTALASASQRRTTRARVGLLQATVATPLVVGAAYRSITAPLSCAKL